MMDLPLNKAAQSRAAESATVRPRNAPTGRRLGESWARLFQWLVDVLDGPQYLTSDEAAERYNVSHRRLRDLARTKAITRYFDAEDMRVVLYEARELRRVLSRPIHPLVRAQNSHRGRK